VRKKKENMEDITTGELKKRRFGLRIDDDVEVYIIAGDVLRVVTGRVLSYRKDIQMVDDEGRFHKISYDWVADLVILGHNRPHPSVDPELERKPKPQEPEEEDLPVDNAFA